MLYIDTSNVIEIKKFKDLGLINGITTNQKILFQDKQTDVKQAIQNILKVSSNLPVNVELTKTSGTDDDLIFEAHEYFDLSKTIVIKVPMWGDGRGLKIAKQLQKNGIPVNITCCMSAEQAILASILEVEYVSLFFNRIVDFWTKEKKYNPYESACKIIKATRDFLDTNGLSTQIISGSIRRPADVTYSLNNGADIVTVTPEILSKMFQHPKTDETIAEFDKAFQALSTKEHF